MFVDDASTSFQARQFDTIYNVEISIGTSATAEVDKLIMMLLRPIKFLLMQKTVEIENIIQNCMNLKSLR